MRLLLLYITVCINYLLFSQIPTMGVIKYNEGVCEGYSLFSSNRDTYLISNCGRIVGISAFGPHVWRTKVTPFAATAAAKASMEVTAKALALQLAPSGITVNLIAPGFVKKDQDAHAAISPETLSKLVAEVPMGRVAEPEEIAAVAVYLAGDDATFTTGTTISVDGGISI